MKEMKTLKFPNQDEAYEIVDAYAREQIDNKVDKVSGKGLSTNDYAATDKVKVDCLKASVKMYGAKGNGSTDDTVAFQNALANNREIFVPSGTYKLSGELVIRDNCGLELAQDVVLNFTQTSGNCITINRSSFLMGNHATVNVPYGFTGHVINVDTSVHTDAKDVLPWVHWSPQWKTARYLTDLNICMAESNGIHHSTDGGSYGIAVYISANGSATSTFIWGLNFSGLRIAGAFEYGIRAVNFNSGWNHEMRLEAFIDACKIGVSFEDCNKAYFAGSIQPRKAANGVVYAEHGIKLVRSKDVELSGSRVWDWNDSNTLWTSDKSNVYQHIAMYGDCRGAILNDYNYYHIPSGFSDIRELIYTDTQSNFDSLVILQEPITKWFKTVGRMPYYFDGNVDKKLATQEELDTYFDTDMVKGFTDVLATATDTDGTIYNGVGYKAGNRLNGVDGSVIIGEDATYTVTGFMPCTVGQTVHVDGMSLDDVNDGCRLCLYDANKNFIRFFVLSKLATSEWYVKGEKTESGFWFSPQSVVGNENIACFRFCVFTKMIGKYPMVAVNEEIKYTFEGFLADSVKVHSSNVEGLSDILGSYITDIDTLIGGEA